MYDHILLPTDGSDATDATIEHAATLAETYDATVHVLSVADSRNRFETPSAGIAPDVWEESERKRAENAADAAIDALPDTVATEKLVEEGVPHAVIIDYADDADIDVVVMATHGRTGLDHYLVGSVTERVVRKSSAPVLTIRASGDE
ncbi:universal stress protein [Haloferax mediterranei ATCC 33500]|uniref:Stress response protein n=1 Tax=Haloferax mediterranei (strain ATCC 33500 / DSM 1411 / JCM 8866 / NBRC 14739 / NCIMB 2177 / R-4) TaxID=523841 RepID=I3R0L3_HALMT|nr:universal stress protein [Haloferax mediterranei]AFK17773.1 stress response protein [Haloferax mediterranei ATCC 33500]AHZ22796.1 universal stress protein UspA [Haloferax mediterranei ATCC 33500]EMA02955.1 stress response protein [Haloferax mediterranei ATCC 33500]MDX5987863.1 universal stress protein [Haloferax mediterranei ATCC 33500]QCQ74339.1 universal stress protein [Haloferax mediterranei ATCC 33500]